MGPVGLRCIVGDSGIGVSLGLGARRALVDDCFPYLCLRWLSDPPLGHEGEQFRFPHHPNRRRAARHLHRPLSPRAPSHVLRRRSHAALHALGAGLLVCAAGLPPRYPFDCPPPPQRRTNALSRPTRLFRLLPPHPLPPPPPPLVVSFKKSRF